MLSAAVFAADPAAGLWKSIDDKTGEVTAIWRIYEEGGKLFGTIAATTSDPQDVIAVDDPPKIDGRYTLDWKDEIKQISRKAIREMSW